MSDDLEAFFNKKKAKVGKKKKAAIQDVNILAKKLEKTVRVQEEIDREQQEREFRDSHNDQQAPDGKEESEWHDYVNNTDIDLAAVGIKEMDKEMEEEQIQEDGEVGEEGGERKTWSNLQEKKKKGEGEESSEEEEEEAKHNGEDKEQHKEAVENNPPKVYISPAMRAGERRAMGAMQNNKAPDTSNAEEFPSLGAAEEIAQTQEAERKKAEARKLAELERRMETKPQSNVYQAPKNAWTRVGHGNTTTTEPAAPEDSPLKKNENAYVPPHLRGK